MPFYMDQITNMIKLHSGKQDQTYGFLDHVMVQEYNPKTNRVKVAYYNPTSEKFDIVTNWLPWLTPSNGQGVNAETGKLWGQVFTPCIGERCYLLPFGGDPNNGIILGGIYTDDRPPPSPDDKFTEAGEWLFQHVSGSYLKFFKNGDVTLYVTGNLNIHVDGNLNEHVVGNITSGAEKNMALTGTSIMLNANSEVMSNAPQTNSSQNLSAGNGASGSFTSVTGEIITVHNGIITNIY